MTNLETLKQQTADLEAKLEEMKAEIDRLENGWKMKCPYEYGNKCYFLQSSGQFFPDCWCGIEFDYGYLSQGNAFHTKKEAEVRKSMTLMKISILLWIQRRIDSNDNLL